MERANWDAMLASARSGNLDAIPSSYLVRHYSTWKNIKKDAMFKPQDCPSVTGVWIQGPSGCGKSRSVRGLIASTGEEFYRKMHTNAWWDGYCDQPYVIVDDVDKYDVKLGGVIKDWTDRYAFTAEAKGGAMSIRPRLVFFTSQYSIGDIWQDVETREALARRCFVVNFFDSTTAFPTMETILQDLASRNISL